MYHIIIVSRAITRPTKSGVDKLGKRCGSKHQDACNLCTAKGHAIGGCENHLNNSDISLCLSGITKDGVTLGGARFIPTRSIPTSVIPTRAIPTPRPEPSIKRVWPTSPLARFTYAVL